MAVQTSKVTTASNGTLQLDPNGSGAVQLTKLAGSGNQPVGVDNSGNTQKFLPSTTAARGTAAGSDIIMVQAAGAAAVTQTTITDLVTAGGGSGGIDLTNLSVTTATTPINQGGLAYDNTTGVFTYTPSQPPASLAEQAAGTLDTVYSTPNTSVAKTAGKTGALYSPAGTTGQRPSGVTGMLRYNTDRTSAEFYDGASWGDLQNESKPVVTSVSVAAAKDQTIIVTTAGQAVTLPASPLAGDMVTVIVAGEFTNTVVSRNGSNIMGLSEDITLDKNYASMDFIYTGNTTEGWRLG